MANETYSARTSQPQDPCLEGQGGMGRGRSPKIVLLWRNDAEGVRLSSCWNSQSTLATQGCMGTGVRKRVRYESAGL